MARAAGLMLSTVVGLLAGCGSDPKPVTKGIGLEGGAVDGDGVQLTIPAGALPTVTEISITPMSDPAPDAYVSVSSVYQFGPDGLTFASPVEVRIDVTETANVQLVWSTAEGNGYELLGGSLDGSVLVGQITHFSRGFAGRESEQLPDAAMPACGGGCPLGEVCYAGSCVLPTECNDTLDNDHDGLIDANDPDCAYNNGCCEMTPSG